MSHPQPYRRVSRRPALVCVLCLLVGGWTTGMAAEPSPPRPDTIPLRQALVIPPTGSAGRSAVHTDAIEAAIIGGTWSAPTEGTVVKLPDGAERKWEPLSAQDDGTLTHRALGGGYAWFAVPSDSERIMILEAAGHGTVYVNGEPRCGDPYSHGFVHLPVRLKTGSNEFLFHVGRGRLNAKLVPPKAAAYIDPADPTLPDLVAGQPGDTWAGILVTNASVEPLTKVAIRAKCLSSAASDEPLITPLIALPPLSTRKVAVRLAASPKSEGEIEFELALERRDPAGSPAAAVLDTAKFKLRVLRPEQTQRHTFRSAIDGSVQYYAIVPALAPTNADSRGTAGTANAGPARAPAGSIVQPSKPALILTLHGAGVEGAGQAACFSSKPGLITVAPTNRRPYGFDWEDWGRMDAIEVLELVEREYGTDPRRTYLTGHSMGGHGTWHVGVTYPAKFAAIGPSAGWISMYSYAGARRPENPDKMQELLLRSAASSDTLALLRNFAQLGVYVLHGDQDDNVPVAQARTMRQKLAEFHPDFVYREQPGAGHWWGNPCVDWPPMVDYFLQHTLPERKDVRQVDFLTVNPGVSSQAHWLSIDAQQRPLLPSAVHVSFDAKTRGFRGTTENVARIVLDVGHLEPAQPVQVQLDNDTIADVAWPEAIGSKSPRIWLERRENRWQQMPAQATALKGAHRYGPFKDAFRNRMQFVYGTQGTAEENAWSLAKARLDAERFWYQGNGSVDVLSDQEFLECNQVRVLDALPGERDRNVILYGNAESHAAWEMLLGASPVQVHRGSVRIGDRDVSGDDLACLFVRPRPDSDLGLIGVVSGSGLVGMRLTERLPYFVSGVGFPDCVVIGAEMLAKGVDGVRAAGFFGPDWSVSTGEFVWRD